MYAPNTAFKRAERVSTTFRDKVTHLHSPQTHDGHKPVQGAPRHFNLMQRTIEKPTLVKVEEAISPAEILKDTVHTGKKIKYRKDRLSSGLKFEGKVPQSLLPESGTPDSDFFSDYLDRRFYASSVYMLDRVKTLRGYNLYSKGFHDRTETFPSEDMRRSRKNTRKESKPARAATIRTRQRARSQEAAMKAEMASMESKSWGNPYDCDSFREGICRGSYCEKYGSVELSCK